MEMQNFFEKMFQKKLRKWKGAEAQVGTGAHLILDLILEVRGRSF